LARAIPFTFIPARPSTVTTEIGDSRVTIRWNDVTEDSSYADGYNVVRNIGSSFNPATSEKLNVDAITDTEFTDMEGATNRVSTTVVPAPVNGNVYSYSVETLVITGLWSILTRNLRVGQSEIIEASKGLHD
jgi:hypothetical protein